MTRFLSALWLITALLPAEPDSVARSKDVSAVLPEIMETPGRAIPQDLLDRAECAVIVPGVKKAAFLIGARYGKGYISCRNPAGMGWSAPGTLRIEGGSVGFQNGGSETDAQIAAQILSWPRSHGAFAGVSPQGANLRQDLDENRDLYGKRLTNRDIIARTLLCRRLPGNWCPC